MGWAWRFYGIFLLKNTRVNGLISETVEESCSFLFDFFAFGSTCSGWLSLFQFDGASVPTAPVQEHALHTVAGYRRHVLALPALSPASLPVRWGLRILRHGLGPPEKKICFRSSGWAQLWPVRAAANFFFSFFFFLFKKKKKKIEDKKSTKH